MPFNKKLLELVIATTAAMVIGSNVHMDLNENNNSQHKGLKISNQKLLVQSDNNSTINDSDTIVMAGNGKAYTDLENIKFNLNGVPVSGRTITVENANGEFIGGGILSNGAVPVSELEQGQTVLGKQDIVIKVQGCKEPIIIKDKNINMLNYEITKVSGLKPGATYEVKASPASQNSTVTANSDGDIFIKRDNAYAYINLYKNGQLIKSLPGDGPISGVNEIYTIPNLKKPETEILPYFVIGKGDIVIDLGTVNRKFVDSNGKVIKEDSFTGEVGTSINKVEIPQGYEVENITVEKNGQVISGELPPTSIGESKITVIYHLQKKKQYGNAIVKVVDGETGKVLAGATVNIDGQILHTDSDGEVQVNDVKPGEISATASDEGYTKVQTSVKVDPNKTVTGIISLMPEAGNVIVTVNGENGPLKNTKITVNGVSETTDVEGQVIVKTSEGPNKIIIGSKNYHNGTIIVDGKPGKTEKANVTLTPDNGTMKITVVDSLTKKALENAKVTYDGKTYTTDSNGEVIISNVVPGNIIVDGSDDNYHNGSTKVEVTPNSEGTGTISLTPDNGTVVIKVVDSKTGKILSGATVNINGQTLRTNSNGEVQINDVKPGEIIATASDKGYTNGQTSVKLEPNGKTTGIISLNPEAGKVVVTVNGENGPLKNTKVTVNGVAETTDGEGQVIVKTSEGPNKIIIGSKNYHNGIITVDGKPGETEKANVTLTPDNGTMKITVVDSSTKKALENAKVTYDGKTYTTDSKGEVTISNVVPGDITVDGSDNNYHNGSTKVEVTPNGEGTGTISLTPDNGTMKITVVDSSTKKALENAKVTYDGKTYTTNSNGEVIISNVVPGNIIVDGSDDNYHNGSTKVEVTPNGEETGTISLTPDNGTMKITVIDSSTKKALENAKVTYDGKTYTTNSNGEVIISNVVPGNIIVDGSDDNYHNGSTKVEVTPNGEGTGTISLTPDNGTMKITVVDSLTKKALKNAKVSYNGKTYTTDSNGEVIISNVVPGDITVDGSDNNYHNGSTKVEVTPNGEGTGTISLTPDNGTMKITVVDSLTKKALENAKVTYDGKTYTTNSNGEVIISNVVPGDIIVDGSDKNYHNGSTKVEVTPNGEGTGTISLVPDDNHKDKNTKIEVDSNGQGKKITSLVPDNGIVVIKVVDSKTGNILSGATVNINGKILRTNSEGEVQVNDVKSGEISATASDNGYTNGQISVKVDPNGKVTGIISLIPESGDVIVTVNGENGPLKNTKVIVNGVPEITDGEGKVIVKTSEGPNTITIGSKNYHNGTVIVDGKPGETEKTNVTLTPDNGTMKITVVDSLTKKVLENSKVTYNGKIYTTDSNGEVIISNVVPGNIIVDGSDKNYHNGSTKVEVTPNGEGTGTISLTPDNGTMKITVVDSSTKKALENAKVTYDEKTYTTDSKGEVTISNVVPGDITVDGSDKNYHSGSTKVEVTPNGEGSGIISLTPDNGTMKITVIDSSTKKALENAKVTYDGKTYTTDSNGEVTITNVIPGDIIVDGSDDNYHSGSTKVEVTPNGEGTGIISLTPDNGTVVIKVVNSKTGKVLSGATVNIDGQILHTNSNGEIQVNDVKPGEIIATASDKGYTNGQTSVKLDPNGKVTGIIALDPEAGKVIITVSGNNGLLRNKKIIVNGKEEKTNSNGQIIVGTTAGTNHIKISVSGYNDKNIDVNVTTGNTKYRTVTLTPKVASVRINTIGKDGNIISSKIVNENNPELTIPKGYKVSSITVNGEKINENNLTKSDLEDKDVSINIVNDKNLPDTGINNDISSNIEGMVTWASILGILGIGEIFRRKNRK